MKGLTVKEEELMGYFWEKGPLFVKEMLAFYEEPKPHFNTLSTIVRGALKIRDSWLIILLGILISTIPLSAKKIFVKGHFRKS